MAHTRREVKVWCTIDNWCGPVASFLRNGGCPVCNLNERFSEMRLETAKGCLSLILTRLRQLEIDESRLRFITDRLREVRVN